MRNEHIILHCKGGSILLHLWNHNAEGEGTTAIVRNYRQLVRRAKQAQVEQKIMSRILQVMGSERNKTVKKKTTRDKKTYFEKLANEAEIAARQYNSRELYKITRQLAGKNKSTSRPVRDKQGNLLTKESLQLQRWKEYFQEIVNRPPPDSIPDIEEATEDLNISCGRISKEEIKRALNKLNLCSAPGINNIPSDVLKADISAATDVLYNLLNEVWDKEEIPTEWKTGVLVTIPKKGNLSECKNWRGITLLSVPSKIICCIILDKIHESQYQIL